MKDREPKPRHNWKTIGPLAEILDRFDAPTKIQEMIGRRTGNLAGTKSLPLSRIEKVIEDSMVVNGGMPNWLHVHERLGEVVHDLYRKLRH